MNMTANVGTADRVIRVLVGIALLVWFFLGTGEVRWIGLIGIIPILTAAAGWCPAYRLLGMSTCAR